METNQLFLEPIYPETIFVIQGIVLLTQSILLWLVFMSRKEIRYLLYAVRASGIWVILGFVYLVGLPSPLFDSVLGFVGLSLYGIARFTLFASFIILLLWTTPIVISELIRMLDSYSMEATGSKLLGGGGLRRLFTATAVGLSGVLIVLLLVMAFGYCSSAVLDAEVPTVSQVALWAAKNSLVMAEYVLVLLVGVIVCAAQMGYFYTLVRSRGLRGKPGGPEDK